jgi:DNA-binding NarL/FixJ family response regulator
MQALRKIVRRVIDRERYAQNKQKRLVQSTDLPAPVNPAEQVWADLKIDLDSGLGELSSRERQVLELRRQGKTFEEIGAETGMSKQRAFEECSGAISKIQELYRSFE